MKNIVLTGIGGQGTVLAAKILAQAAQARGWHVRTAETIGMAQRGGSVVSHVRMGDCGERVASPLVPQGTADMLIAFEPGEGMRMLPALARGGAMVTATRAVQPVTASLSREVYAAAPVLDALRARAMRSIDAGEGGCTEASGASRRIGSLYVVDEAPLLARIGNTKALNIVLLGVAVAADGLGISFDELERAVAACVKPRFVEANLHAIAIVREVMVAM